MQPSTPLGSPHGHGSTLRPTHQLSRSISEISPPTSRRPHLLRREKDDKLPNYATPLRPRPSFLSERSESGFKSEGVTPNDSRSGSRRPSLLLGDEPAEMALWQQKRPVKEGEVKEEREKSVQRATYVNHCKAVLSLC